MRSASPPKPETLWPSRWREVDMEGSPHSPPQGGGYGGNNFSPEDNKIKTGEEKDGKNMGESAPIAKTTKRKEYIHRCAFSHNCSHRKNRVSEPSSFNITSEAIGRSHSRCVVSNWDTPKIENTFQTSLNDKDFCQLMSDVRRADILSRTGSESKSVQDYGVHDNKLIYIERGLPFSGGPVRDMGRGGRGGYRDSIHSQDRSQGGLEQLYHEGPLRPLGSAYSPYTPSLSYSQLPSRISSLRTESPPPSSASPVSVSDTANLLASWSHPTNPSNVPPCDASSLRQTSSHCHLHKAPSPSPLPPPSAPFPSSPRPSSSCPCDKEFGSRAPTPEEITPNFRKFCRNFFLETLCPGATGEEVRQVASAVECLEERVYLYNVKSKMDYCYQLAKKLCCIQEELRHVSKRSSEEIPNNQEKSKEDVS